MNDGPNADATGGGTMKKGCLWIAGILGVLLVIGIVAEPPEDRNGEQLAVADNASDEVIEASNPLESGSDDQAAPILTIPQRNAQRSAKQYLSMSGFSRAGLIGQLSHDAGDGYNVADATVAVDSLSVDWNEQAVRSARQYLDMMGMSCKGLTQQLSSSAGEKYSAS